MKKLTTLLICTTFAFSAGAALAQSTTPQPDGTNRHGMNRGDMNRDDMNRDDMNRDDMHRDGMKRDDMHKDAMNRDAMNKDGSMQRAPTMQECRDHVAMAKKTNPPGDAGKSNDDSMKRLNTTCADMMNRDATGTTPASKY